MVFDRHKTIGLTAMLGLVILYFSILTFSNVFFVGQTLAESFGHATGQFGEMWYYVLILSAGFGIQAGLFSFIKSGVHSGMKGAAAEVAASGSVSTASMAACCAHHIVEVAPLLGISAAAMFLTKYQTPFIVVGIFSNVIGITIMLGIIQKHRLYGEGGIFYPLFGLNMKTVRNAAIVISIIAVSTSFAYASAGSEDSVTAGMNATQLDLAEVKKRADGVTIKAKPVEFAFDKPVKFKIVLNTHSGSLDFDLTNISLLVDGAGNSYEPLQWEGSPPGGHHRSGTVIFPKLKGNTGLIKLVIKNVSGKPESVFEWSLNNGGSSA